MQHDTKHKKHGISADELRELLDYCPTSGAFVWRIDRTSGTKAGQLAGSTYKDGYTYISVMGRIYKAHRLAWLHVYGRWPSGSVDHKNGCKSDNRIDNLRDVPHATNLENQRAPRADNKTGGLLGVSLHRKTGKFRAQIMASGRTISLGLHETPELAHAAYIDAKRSLHKGCTL